MALLIRILFLVLIVAAVVWIVDRMARGRELKCAGCRHCRKLFHDGSLCGYGARETFKTIVHIENCMDYDARDRSKT